MAARLTMKANMYIILYSYLVSVTFCLSLCAISMATRKTYLFNRFNQKSVCYNLEKAAFIGKIYEDAQSGSHRGLAQALIQSITPGVNFVISLHFVWRMATNIVKYLVMLVVKSASRLNQRAITSLASFLNKSFRQPQ